MTHAADPLPGSVRWLLVGSLAAAMVSVAALTFALEAHRTDESVYLVAERALLLGTIYTGLRVWAGMTRAGDLEERV